MQCRSMESGPFENGKDSHLHQASSLNMQHEGGSHDMPNLPQPSHQIMQDDPLQSSATLVPPLASYPPMGANYLYYTVPPRCPPPEKIITKGAPNGSLRECDLDVEEDKKPDKEHKKRSKNWTRPETLKLIRLRTELAAKFNKAGRKSDLWEQIASSLQQDHISRDAQQCRDKWEKLMAGYKEVKDGIKDRDEYPFYEELYPLLSGKLARKDRDHELNEAGPQQSASGPKEAEREGPFTRFDYGSDRDDDGNLEERPSLKRKKYVAVTDLQAVQAMLEMVISQQQKIFKDFLDTLERKEQQREQIRQEREEKWRAEELAQSRILNDAMIVLTEKLVGERVGAATTSMFPTPVVCNQAIHQGQMVPMKRSKNWKRTEVLQLIKLRGEMESRFAKSTRRASLWEELSETLDRQGIKRDGKQCREKWDKLMAEYKDVSEGKREEGDSSYFQELMAVVGNRPSDNG
ncbi:hypothetical protein GOP47_0028829 [Adiantum capillus-veneris]|nr:hypothetical protein GOP47_0028829 [Adiantum capillus-veneris]